jgi:hypothetical protein
MDASSLPFCWYLSKIDDEVFDDAETKGIEGFSSFASSTDRKINPQVLLIDPITGICV